MTYVFSGTLNPTQSISRGMGDESLYIGYPASSSTTRDAIKCVCEHTIPLVSWIYCQHLPTCVWPSPCTWTCPLHPPAQGEPAPSCTASLTRYEIRNVNVKHMLKGHVYGTLDMGIPTHTLTETVTLLMITITVKWQKLTSIRWRAQQVNTTILLWCQQCTNPQQPAVIGCKLPSLVSNTVRPCPYSIQFEAAKKPAWNQKTEQHQQQQ